MPGIIVAIAIAFGGGFIFNAKCGDKCDAFVEKHITAETVVYEYPGQ